MMFVTVLSLTLLMLPLQPNLKPFALGMIYIYIYIMDNCFVFVVVRLSSKIHPSLSILIRLLIYPILSLNITRIGPLIMEYLVIHFKNYRFWSLSYSIFIFF